VSEATLRQAVETQARARIERNESVFASYCTPQALTAMRALPRTLARRFETLAVVASGNTGSSDVLYKGRGAHVLAQRWQLVDGVWTVVDVRRLAAPQRSLWQRIASLFARSERQQPADRHDVDEAA
jgi:hypothetical protein